MDQGGHRPAGFEDEGERRLRDMERLSRKMNDSLRRMSARAAGETPFDAERLRGMEREAARLRKMARGVTIAAGCLAALAAVAAVVLLPFTLAAAAAHRWSRSRKLRRLRRSLGDPKADPQGTFDRAIELAAAEFRTSREAVEASLLWQEPGPTGGVGRPVGARWNEVESLVASGPALLGTLRGYEFGPLELAVERLAADIVISHRLRVAQCNLALRPLRLELTRFDSASPPFAEVRPTEVGGWEVVLGGVPLLEFAADEEAAARRLTSRLSQVVNPPSAPS
ncbi:MAG TPA: hypothetical protein VI643_03475 [Planctomycetota bacterium]|nr:hypothetical protein [Planctomycetota bacterium]